MALGELRSPHPFWGKTEDMTMRAMAALAQRSKAPFQPTLSLPEMAMDGAFKAQVVSIFGLWVLASKHELHSLAWSQTCQAGGGGMV